MKVDLNTASDILLSGKIVAIPTETVYGLAADALNPDAVLQIFEAKSRPRFNPLICHLPHVAEVKNYCHPPASLEVLASLWPGPLTILMPHNGSIPSLVTAGSPLCAFRVPSHPIALELLKKVRRPLAAPSANKSGRVSPVNADMVEREFRGSLPVLDGGQCSVGLESTIVLAKEDSVSILRNGKYTALDFENLGLKVEPAARDIRAPGQMLRHYAPEVPLVLLTREQKAAESEAIHVDAKGKIAWLGFRGSKPPFDAQVFELSQSGDLHEAARHLFFYFDRMARERFDYIVAELVPEEGIGLAINDRLRRAADMEGSVQNGRLSAWRIMHV